MFAMDASWPVAQMEVLSPPPGIWLHPPALGSQQSHPMNYQHRPVAEQPWRLDHLAGRQALLCANIRPPPGLEDVLPFGGPLGKFAAPSLPPSSRSTSPGAPPSVTQAVSTSEGSDVDEDQQLMVEFGPDSCDALPSLGSKDHHLGSCRPCVFVHKEGGCANGASCAHCHLCDAGEKKRRKDVRRTAAQRRNAAS